MTTPGTGITPSGTQLAALALGRRTVVLDSANRTLTQDDSGKTFVAQAADLVYTLPAAADVGAGCQFRFVTSALSTGTGLSVSPVAADGIVALGATTGVVNKDIINSGASDALGDMVEVVSTGAAGTGAWVVVGQRGTWAKES